MPRPTSRIVRAVDTAARRRRFYFANGSSVTLVDNVYVCLERACITEHRVYDCAHVLSAIEYDRANPPATDAMDTEKAGAAPTTPAATLPQDRSTSSGAPR